VRYTRAKVGHRQDPFVNLTPQPLTGWGVLLCVRQTQDVLLSQNFYIQIYIHNLWRRCMRRNAWINTSKQA
jgi:hypothetical protein